MINRATNIALNERIGKYVSLRNEVKEEFGLPNPRWNDNVKT